MKTNLSLKIFLGTVKKEIFSKYFHALGIYLLFETLLNEAAGYTL